VTLDRLKQWARQSPPDLPDNPDGGMTLVELLIVLVIMPMVIGAIALALVTSLQDSGGVAARLAESSDVQLASEFFGRDVESAASLTTDSSLAHCGSGTTLLLSLSFSPGGAGDEVTYWETIGAGASYELTRDFCTSGHPPVTAVIATTIQPGSTMTVTVSPPPSDSNDPNSGWITTSGLSAIELQGVEESSASGDASAASTEFPIDLVATPRVSTSASQGVDPGGNP
jgi:type II secretory pathway pseudopilin PulG